MNALRGWFFILFGIWPFAVHGYPEFIGYGYSSCLTCHYNSAGGGPLNDYGRALWSAEIASRWLYPSSTSDEALADESGFLGPVKLPFWLRPHGMYRGLGYQTNPGSTQHLPVQFLHMQADFGATVASETGRYLATFTIGRMVKPEDYSTGRDSFTRFFAREYFIRLQLFEKWWVSVGLLEKIFGLRNVDHTSYQRTYQGFNEVIDNIDGIANSQGLIIHRIDDKWEIAANYFIGNPYDDPPYRQHGFSAMGEVEVGEKKRLGASILSSTNSIQKKQMAAVHYRQGLSKASAVMLEGGLIDNQQSGNPNAKGSYALVQSLISLVRGYNLKISVEHYNQTFQSTQPDQWKWTFGFLIFPAPRFELRADVMNARSLTPNSSTNDTWTLLGQIHVSL